MLGMLVALALACSIFPLTIDPAGELFLGGIALLIIVRKYGALWGALTALLCGLSTFALLGHPFAALLSLAEVLVVGLLLGRFRVRLFFADAIYWLLLGLPLSWYFRFTLLHSAPSQPFEYLLLQGGFALGCAVVACLLLPLPPLRSCGGGRAISIWEGALNLVLCCALAPLVGIILLNLYKVDAELEPDRKEELTAACLAIEKEKSSPIETLTAERMKKILKRKAGPGAKLAFIDRNGEVAASSDPALKEGENLFGTYREASVLLWDQENKRLIGYPPWKRLFPASTHLVDRSPLLLAAEIPVDARLDRLRRDAPMMMTPALAVALACLILWRRLTIPLRQLAAATAGLPRKVEAQEEIEWPKRTFSEIEAISRNSMAMAAAMKDKLEELALARQKSSETLDDALAQRNWEAFTTGRRLRLEMDKSKRIAGLLADLEAAESQYRFLMEKAMVGVFIIQEGKLTYANPKFADIFGHSQTEILGRGDILLFIHPEDRPVMAERHRKHMKGESGTSQCELRGTTKTGRQIHLEVTDGRGDYNGEPAIIGTLMDITHRKEAEETIKHMAYHDPLTDLPNRPLFKDHAGQALAFADRNRHMAALLFMDLDRFKQINDTLGHAVGDGLLKEVAARLKGCVRDIDKVSRYGGDEFNLLLAQLTQEDNAALVAHKIVRTLQWPFNIEGHEIYVTCSIGIAIYPQNGLDVDTLIRNADTALYRAKDLGRNNYQVFTENMNSGSMERMELENRLRKVLEREELKIHYQPQVSLKTGKIVGMEALVRWEHPSGDHISPAVFIPMAEELGLILPIGEWILRTACRQAKAWSEEGLHPLRLGVNVSAFQFQDRGFMQMLEGAIKETGFDPRNLNLEITETIVMDDVKANLAKLARIHDVGITVAIDDFGIGYSSLSYLKDFPVDQLKMDRAFVQSLPDNTDDAKIARHIVELAHSLGIPVVAEGVEHPGQLEFLRSIGCEEVQGFLVSKALPPQEFRRLQKQEDPFRLGPTESPQSFSLDFPPAPPLG